ncbi:hypothetical protein WICPIJ_004303 [Wickerhamomyces pijperi]|uniref:Uncharacterized protein n=1 Tax=Wickerhamomyces pijperi TaxID=599730 RepID=A0A9P8Q7Y4_WICPI|nr:hypothetical protein WICPIJ_004303 [Wickerhamomyces pijperi]
MAEIGVPKLEPGVEGASFTGSSFGKMEYLGSSVDFGFLLEVVVVLIGEVLALFVNGDSLLLSKSISPRSTGLKILKDDLEVSKVESFGLDVVVVGVVDVVADVAVGLEVGGGAPRSKGDMRVVRHVIAQTSNIERATRGVSQTHQTILIVEIPTLRHTQMIHGKVIITSCIVLKLNQQFPRYVSESHPNDPTNDVFIQGQTWLEPKLGQMHRETRGRVIEKVGLVPLKVAKLVSVVAGLPVIGKCDEELEEEEKNDFENVLVLLLALVFDVAVEILSMSALLLFLLKKTLARDEDVEAEVGENLCGISKAETGLFLVEEEELRLLPVVFGFKVSVLDPELLMCASLTFSRLEFRSSDPLELDIKVGAAGAAVASEELPEPDLPSLFDLDPDPDPEPGPAVPSVFLNKLINLEAAEDPKSSHILIRSEVQTAGSLTLLGNPGTIWLIVVGETFLVEEDGYTTSGDKCSLWIVCTVNSGTCGGAECGDGDKLTGVRLSGVCVLIGGGFKLSVDIVTGGGFLTFLFLIGGKLLSDISAGGLNDLLNPSVLLAPDSKLKWLEEAASLIMSNVAALLIGATTVLGAILPLLLFPDDFLKVSVG